MNGASVALRRVAHFFGVDIFSNFRRIFGGSSVGDSFLKRLGALRPFPQLDACGDEGEDEKLYRISKYINIFEWFLIGAGSLYVGFRYVLDFLVTDPIKLSWREDTFFALSAPFRAFRDVGRARHGAGEDEEKCLSFWGWLSPLLLCCWSFFAVPLWLLVVPLLEVVTTLFFFIFGTASNLFFFLAVFLVNPFFSFASSDDAFLRPLCTAAKDVFPWMDVIDDRRKERAKKNKAIEEKAEEERRIANENEVRVVLHAPERKRRWLEVWLGVHLCIVDLQYLIEEKGVLSNSKCFRVVRGGGDDLAKVREEIINLRAPAFLLFQEGNGWWLEVWTPPIAIKLPSHPLAQVQDRELFEVRNKADIDYLNKNVSIRPETVADIACRAIQAGLDVFTDEYRKGWVNRGSSHDFGEDANRIDDFVGTYLNWAKRFLFSQAPEGEEEKFNKARDYFIKIYAKAMETYSGQIDRSGYFNDEVSKQVVERKKGWLDNFLSNVLNLGNFLVEKSISDFFKGEGAKVCAGLDAMTEILSQEKKEAMKREEKERQEKEKERQEKEEAMKEVARLKEYVRKMEEDARKRGGGGDFFNGGNFFGKGVEGAVSKGVGCRGAEDVEASEKEDDEAVVKGLGEEGKGL